MFKNGFFKKIKFSPADAATAMNLVCGFMSMLMAAQGRPVQAVWLIVMAMVFDSIDGNLAKMFNTVSDFGRELDSLSDMVSFGIAPAFLFAMIFVSQENFLLGFLAPAAYAVCAAIRLARFNLRPPVRGYFLGLPSPAAALGAAAFMLAALNEDWLALPMLTNTAWLMMAGLAFLMISPIPYPKPFGSEYKKWKPFFGLAATATLLIGFVLNREIAFLAATGFYIIGTPLEGLTLNRKASIAIN